jgi:hypothetical protein
MNNADPRLDEEGGLEAGEDTNTAIDHHTLDPLGR